MKCLCASRLEGACWSSCIWLQKIVKKQFPPSQFERPRIRAHECKSNFFSWYQVRRAPYILAEWYLTQIRMNIVRGQEIQISICLFETKILINEILQQLEAGAHLLPSAEYSKGWEGLWMDRQCAKCYALEMSCLDGQSRQIVLEFLTLQWLKHESH